MLNNFLVITLIPSGEPESSNLLKSLSMNMTRCGFMEVM